MAKAKKKSKSKKNKEEVCETFEIQKKDKKAKNSEKEPEVKTVCGMMEKKHATSEEIKNQNKLLRNILIILGLLFLLLLGFLYFSGSSYEFKYRGISGRIVQEGNIILYETPFPYNHQGKIIPWYIYIRNDPRQLDRIKFQGEMDFGVRFIEGQYGLIADVSEELSPCSDTGIAITNMINLQAIGVKFVRNVDDLSCDEEGRYMYINIKPGDKTEIIQVGNACYDILVKDCDILRATERFMVEMFVEFYKNQ